MKRQWRECRQSRQVGQLLTSVAGAAFVVSSMVAADHVACRHCCILGIPSEEGETHCFLVYELQGLFRDKIGRQARQPREGVV